MVLTPKQLQVLKLITEGLTNQQIGQQLGCTRLSISNVVRDIYDRTGMCNRLELALWYLSHEHDVIALDRRLKCPKSSNRR